MWFDVEDMDAAIAELDARYLAGDAAPPGVEACPVWTPRPRERANASRQRLIAEAWDEFDRLFAPEASVESRRKVVGFAQTDLPSDEVIRQTWHYFETGAMRVNHVVIAVRGERLALARIVL